MNRFSIFTLVWLSFFIFTSSAWSKPSSPLPMTAFDGGVFSAETLGRGKTFAASNGTYASGSENPAALYKDQPNGLFTTLQVGRSSELSSIELNETNPVSDKVMQYLALGGGNGVMYFEPMGRIEKWGVEDLENPAITRDLKFSADAIGFAVSESWRRGRVGLSMAYIRSTLLDVSYTEGNLDSYTIDEGNGGRINFGFQFPTGSAMWGLTLQNFPGFVFWDNHKREILPITIRFGNTWQAQKNVLFSADFETRFYNEGSKKENLLHAGMETTLSEHISVLAGASSNDTSKSDKAHYTWGLVLKFPNNLNITYAMDIFKASNEKAKISYLSIRLPFVTDDSIDVR